MISMLLSDRSIGYLSLETFAELFGKYIQDYIWMLSDIECICDIEEIADMTSKDYIWMTGKELLDLGKVKNLSFSWAVFSGFKKEIKEQEVLNYPIPYADGNSGIFENTKTLQNPLAEIEIIVFDSTCLVIRNAPEILVEELRNRFSNIELL